MILYTLDIPMKFSSLLRRKVVLQLQKVENVPN